MVNFNKYIFIFLIAFSCISLSAVENVIIVVIDGARYTETFGTGATYIPNMWNDMKPYGTVYNNFYNYGETNTCPGHASIVTGTWQYIANDGSEHPIKPTIFEYYRKSTGKPENSCWVLAGTDKLNILQYSSDTEYGAEYTAACTTNDYTGDLITWQNMIHVMDIYHPNLILMNLKDVDMIGHEFGYPEYFTAVTRADSIVYQLWLKIQSDSHYQNATTLIVTCDHGMFYIENQDTYSHGDSSEDSQHLIFLAIGEEIPGNSVINTIRTQRDIAPTVGDLMGFATPYAEGTSLFSGDGSLPVTLSWFTAKQSNGNIILEWQTESETENLGFVIERQTIAGNNEPESGRLEIASYKTHPALQGHGSTSSSNSYTFKDKLIIPGTCYEYRLADVSFNGVVEYHKTVVIQAQKVISELWTVYPNPFNSTITIAYTLVEESPVSLQIVNLMGKTVRMFSENRYQAAGYYALHWNGKNDSSRDMAGGVYFIVLHVNDKVSTQKVILAR
ncbi:alkaline phosphatase family protein [bacterium]|nr:alkaline phosphatase family protein [bacterium]MBU1635857.1 alkaline phosphatase family protein [bacterium]MBU1873478.1 alkaline phosphatase family protein [bacterium]